MKTKILIEDNICLRPFKKEDAKECYDNLTSSKEVYKYLLADLHTDIEQTISWLSDVEKEEDSETFYLWAICDNNSKAIYGSIGLFYDDRCGRMELGYSLMQSQWNKGIISKACNIVMKYACSTIGAVKFVAYCSKDNMFSKKILKKLGFRYVSTKSESTFTGSKTMNIETYYYDDY